MVTAEDEFIIIVCHATRPDDGLIKEGTGGGVKSWGCVAGGIVEPRAISHDR